MSRGKLFVGLITACSTLFISGFTPQTPEDEPREPYLPSTWQPWQWNGYVKFPSLYFAAEPEGPFSDEQLAKIDRFELAILEFRLGQFMDEEGTGRWAEGDLASLMDSEATRITDFSPDSPPVLTYLSALWAGSMYKDQRELLDNQSLFLPDARDCEGFIEYPQDVDESGFTSPADYCRWDFRRPKSRRAFLDVVQQAISANASGVFFDGGHSVACDEASELSRLTKSERRRFMDQQNSTYRAAFEDLVKHGAYPILATTIGFKDIGALVPFENDCPRAEEDLLQALDGVPFARYNEFWMWNLGDIASRQIRNTMLEARNGVPTIVHMPYFPKDGGCLEGCYGTDDRRIDFTEQEFLEFGVAAFLVSMGPGSYFGFSDMQSDAEGGGWFDESWEHFALYDEIVTGRPIGETAVSKDGMRFTRVFENGVASVNVADGTYRLDFR